MKYIVAAAALMIATIAVAAESTTPSTAPPAASPAADGLNWTDGLAAGLHAGSAITTRCWSSPVRPIALGAKSWPSNCASRRWWQS